MHKIKKYEITNPGIRALPERLTVTQLVKNFPIFDEAIRFMTSQEPTLEPILRDSFTSHP
jgi:hypothetical protein